MKKIVIMAILLITVGCASAAVTGFPKPDPNYPNVYEKYRVETQADGSTLVTKVVNTETGISKYMTIQGMDWPVTVQDNGNGSYLIIPAPLSGHTLVAPMMMPR